MIGCIIIVLYLRSRGHCIELKKFGTISRFASPDSDSLAPTFDIHKKYLTLYLGNKKNITYKKHNSRTC